MQALHTLVPVRTSRQRSGAGFSLIEMLVVLVILTVVIAIVVPTIQAFRNTSRKAVTRDIMASLATSIGQFRLSQNRLPGYFSVREIGGANNAEDTNFTSMENMMLELAGGITQDAESAFNQATICDPVSGPAVITVGPDPNKRVRVKLGRIGAVDGGSAGEVVRGYYKPDPKYFVRQCQPNKRAGPQPLLHWGMPVLVDAWGSPILAWNQDSVPGTGFPLVSPDSSMLARYYWQSNLAFVRAKSLGKLGRDQATESILGHASLGPESVRGIIGNPAFVGEPRSPVVMHSAGANGVYIGIEERGSKSQGLLTGGSLSRSLPAPAGRDYFEEGDFDDVIGKAE